MSFCKQDLINTAQVVGNFANKYPFLRLEVTFSGERDRLCKLYNLESTGASVDGINNKKPSEQEIEIFLQDKAQSLDTIQLSFRRSDSGPAIGSFTIRSGEIETNFIDVHDLVEIKELMTTLCQDLNLRLPRPITLLQSKDVDIYQKPELNPQSFQQLSIGDLHANAMKLLFFLVREGIFDISAEDYSRLALIYQKNLVEQDVAETKKDLAVFTQIIESLTLKRKALVRLIGDELCDRGQNDYFILKILDKLTRDGVPTEILLSNHGISFVAATELLKQSKGKFENRFISWSDSTSLMNLEKLSAKGIISAEEVMAINKRSYRPNLKLLSYSLSHDNSEITIYSHAGIDLKPIKCLAVKLKVKYTDSSALQLAQTIERINEAFAQSIASGTVHTLYSTEEVSKGDELLGMTLTLANPLEFILWNRHYNKLNRAQNYRDYKINYVHGHDSDGKTKDNLYNLDNDLGKALDKNKGQYFILGSDDHALTSELKLLASIADDSMDQTLLEAELKADSDALKDKPKAGYGAVIKDEIEDIAEFHHIDAKKAESKKGHYYGQASKVDAAKIIKPDGKAVYLYHNKNTKTAPIILKTSAKGDPELEAVKKQDCLGLGRPSLQASRRFAHYDLDTKIVHAKGDASFIYAMEYCNLGSLAERMEQFRGNQSQCHLIIKQLVEGTALLEAKGLVWLAFEPKNILLSSTVTGGIASSLQYINKDEPWSEDVFVKMRQDRGMIKMAEVGKSEKIQVQAKYYQNKLSHYSQAPEITEETKVLDYHPSQNCYMLGCVIFELVTGKKWDATKHQLEDVAEQPIQNLLARLLEPNPTTRISASQIMTEFEWIKQIQVPVDKKDQNYQAKQLVEKQRLLGQQEAKQREVELVSEQQALADLFGQMQTEAQTIQQQKQQDLQNKSILINKLRLDINNEQHMAFWAKRICFGGIGYKGHKIPHTIARVLKIIDDSQESGSSYLTLKNKIQNALKQKSDSWSSFFGCSCPFRSHLLQQLRDCEDIADFNSADKLQHEFLL